MQREEGFNTKMADGPDEYETETGCVPLLHPEVRDRRRAPLPGPGARGGRSLRLAARAAAEASARDPAGREAEGASPSRPERGGGSGERITGEEIAGRARPGRALGRRPWRCLEGRGGDVVWVCLVAALLVGAEATGAC